MILKIRAANPEAKESWRFFDGVQDLHYSVYDTPNTESEKGLQKAKLLCVQEIYFICDTPASKEVFLSFVSELCGAVEIHCNTECYLLNDSGKTIEKLI